MTVSNLDAMRSSYASLAEEIRALGAAGPLLYVPNQGNWGAAVTRLATLGFFAANGIRVHEVDRVGMVALVLGGLRGHALVYGGGGAWSPLYDGGLRAVARAAPWLRHTVVLPSAYGQPVSIPRCTFWARDLHASLKAVPQARFCHDLGFFLGPLIAAAPEEPRGDFFRNDRLARGAGPNCRLPDLSSRGTERSPVAPFIAAISRFEEIHTDRVHVAIIACLLGRTCHVYATGTSMLGDLFRSSIEPHFPAARLHDDPPAADSAVQKS